LGRSYEEIHQHWNFLSKEKGVDIVILDAPMLDTRRHKDLIGTFISDMILAVLSMIAQQERDFIRQRQAEGIALAKAQGVHLGRTAAPLPEDFDDLVQQWRNRQISFAELLCLTGMSKTTFYRRLAKQDPNI
jgi:DNA invertase Pin-like site-specific DNA recombinase